MQNPSKAPLLIGLVSHAPRSGKSTIADHLVGHHGFIVLPFAGPLKQICLEVLWHAGVSESDAQRYTYRDKEAVIPELGVTARYLQQTLGTDWGRRLINPNLWINAWAHKCRTLCSAIEMPPARIVVDDVRFPDEADCITGFGGQLWEIRRPGHNPRRPLPRWVPDWTLNLLPRPLRSRLHVSEGQLVGRRDFSRCIVNDGSTEQLRTLLDFVALGGWRRTGSTVHASTISTTLSAEGLPPLQQS